MLRQKKLSEEILNEEKISSVEANLDEHVKWAFLNIYNVPYPSKENKHAMISRNHHGIQHVSRAAYYVTVLANLYRKYGDEHALALTEREIKLMQIALVFHDAARENEGEDKWDHESALLLYYYLTKKCGATPIEAKKFAEAVANKDPDAGKGYFSITVLPDGEAAWQWKPQQLEKNIYQKIIHDADCLDIMRVKKHFDARYLDFYKTIANQNKYAMNEMAECITEIRSLIDMQGDSPIKCDLTKKINYEHVHAWSDICKSIHDSKYPILNKLGHDLLSADELHQMTLIETDSYRSDLQNDNANLRAALREGKNIFKKYKISFFENDETSRRNTR